MYEDQTFDVILQRMLSRGLRQWIKGRVRQSMLHWHRQQWN